MHTRAHGCIRLQYRERNMSQSRESVGMLDKYGGPKCCYFGITRTGNAVTYNTFRAKPWTMMIWRKGGSKIIRMNRYMKLCTHFQDTSTACRTVMSPLRLGRLHIKLVLSFPIIVSKYCHVPSICGTSFQYLGRASRLL